MRSEWLLKRCVGVLPFVLVAIAAYFQARGVSALVGSLLGGVGQFSRAVHALSRPASDAAPKSGHAILANNPFDSTSRTLAPASAPVAFDSSDPLAWPLCEGLQVLIISESKDPSWSLTTLREANEPRARLRRVGDAVAGKQVAFIGYNPRQQAPAVWLEGGGGYCQSQLFRRQKEVESRSSEPVSRPSDPEVRVERAVVESAQAHPSSLMRSVVVVPDKQNGAIVGLKLLRIKPGSLLASLGLQSGDRLETINGFSMNSPERALQAYAQLRSAERLNVKLSRAGKPVELTLNIN